MSDLNRKSSIYRAKLLTRYANWRDEADCPDDWTWQELTLLMKAVLDFPHERELIADILQHSKNLELRDETSQFTALHFAAQGRAERAMKQLLEAGADPNVQDVHGRTPLFVALTRLPYAVNLVKLLLEHGARTDIRNAAGLTVIDRMNNAQAKEFHAEVLALLEGADG